MDKEPGKIKEELVTDKEITNITPEIRANFDALLSGQYTNFALLSCFVNDEPGAAIVLIVQDSEDAETPCHTYPLFVSVTPNMKLTDHDGEEPKETRNGS